MADADWGLQLLALQARNQASQVRSSLQTMSALDLERCQKCIDDLEKYVAEQAALKTGVAGQEWCNNCDCGTGAPACDNDECLGEWPSEDEWGSWGSGAPACDKDEWGSFAPACDQPRPDKRVRDQFRRTQRPHDQAHDADDAAADLDDGENSQSGDGPDTPPGEWHDEEPRWQSVSPVSPSPGLERPDCREWRL